MDFAPPYARRGLEHDPQWYRRAVFYEVMVRSFADTNSDGIGDIPGLISKLDYLEWLGVDALWLQPFYSSPLRDGGYDVANFMTVLPEFGTIDDFQELVSQAHARNMRIVMDYPSITPRTSTTGSRNPGATRRDLMATITCGPTPMRSVSTFESFFPTRKTPTGLLILNVASSTFTASSPTSRT